MKKLFPLWIILLTLSSAIAYSNVLNFGDPSVAYLTPFEEKELGQQMMQQLRQSGAMLQDPIVTEYIQYLGQRLVGHCDAPQTKITFFVVKSSVINAFAGPGGYIGINTGLIIFTHKESELAAVMAHEIAHVTQHHLARMFEEVKMTRIPTLAAGLASIAIGLINPALGVGAFSAATAGYEQNLINFTRANEREADRIGMKTLYNAGFDPMSMPLLFEDLGKNMLLYPNDVPQLLRSHPYDRERIADSINRAELYPKRTYQADNLQFDLIRARVRVEMSNNPLALAAYFKDPRYIKTPYQKIGHEYGYALALISGLQYAKAQQSINQLIVQYPNQILFTLANASLASAERNFNRAIEILQQAYQADPDYFPVASQYAITLFDAGKYKEAIPILRNLTFEYPNYYTLYFYLANAQAKEGEFQDAYLNRARMYKALGNLAAAKTQLQMGLKETGKNPYGKLQLQAMLQSLSG